MNNINHRPETVYNEFVREKGDDYVSKKVFKQTLRFYANHYQEQQVEQEQKLKGGKLLLMFNCSMVVWWYVWWLYFLLLNIKISK